jgi:hypothetical protein
MTSEALLHDSDSFPSPVTLGQHSEALVVTNDTLPVDDPMLPVNVASTPVVNPSGPIATALLDDMLSSTRNATGRRTRKKLRLQRSYAAENPPPQIPTPVVDTIQVLGSTPNGINTIPDATMNLDLQTVSSPGAMITDSAEQASGQMLDATPSTSSVQDTARGTYQISNEHYKWFTSVHNCWMGHRGVKATLDLLKQRKFYLGIDEFRHS